MMASTSSPNKKRKFDEVSSDPQPNTDDVVQPLKKFKKAEIETDIECISISENPPSSNQNIPTLEQEQSENNDGNNRCKDDDDENATYQINDRVQIYLEDLLQNAKILDSQQKNGNILYLIHYDALSSVHDEWVPAHKISPFPISNQPQPQITDNNESEQTPIYNTKLLEIIPKPAKNFNFELDTFQFEAIKSLETEHVNLLITAHTSAGKTVVAEYAIAKALANNQRVIYTSPIKALSNQKYREFTEKFGHSNIGLITGDVTKRKNASILVMTTEILRNMLYKGGSELREVAFVIFDEVHYMKDMERGVVWEESIILLAKKITLIFLSATLSNSDDFAAWITDLKDRECKIIGTETRPIELEHYVLPNGADSLYLVASSKEREKFLDSNFEHAIAVKNMQKTYKQMDKERKKSKLKVSELQMLLQLLLVNEWCPAIVFAFSKREVEGHALALNDAINFCTKEESEMIEDVFNNAIDGLSDKDKELPAIKSLLPLLKKGIGVHHGGIMPILKEVTEILFQEGMIKVLFATETFAMGVNMPAKCVVFGAVEKFDGQSMRYLHSGEYTQMAGRAGRRGIDEKGVVIMMMDANMTKEICKELMCGKAAALTSSFRLTYNMILNISKNIRTNVTASDMDQVRDENDEQISYQTVIEKSFYRFLMTQRVPQIEARLNDLRKLLTQIEEESDFNEMKIYFDLYSLKEKILTKAHGISTQGRVLNKYLRYGRIVFVNVPLNEIESEEKKFKTWGWGIVCGWSKQFQPDTHFVDVLIPSMLQTEKRDFAEPEPIIDDEIDLLHPVNFQNLSREKRQKYGLNVVRFDTKCIAKVSSIRITTLPSRIISDSEYFSVYDKLHSVHKHFVGSIPTLNVFTDMNICKYLTQEQKTLLSEDFNDRLPKLDERMKETEYFKKKLVDKKDSDILILYRLYLKYKASKKEYNKLTNKITTYNVGQFAKELKCKCRVLKKLEYLSEDNILTPKGIAASYLEINHEILITELMFDNFFQKLSVEEVCAVLSMFIVDRPSKKTQSSGHHKVTFPVPEIVHESYQNILIKARTVLMIKRECGLSEEFGLFDNISFKDEDDYIGSFSPDLIKPIFQWVNGADFAEVNKLTVLFEGALIRLIKRLRDVVNQLADSAKAIGNEELAKKFGDCIEKLQRGIVFAASLYVDDMEEESDESGEEEEQSESEDDVDVEMVQSEENENNDDEETKQAMIEIFGDAD